MSARALATAIHGAAIVVALTLLAFGVIGWAWYWFVLFVASSGTTSAVLRMNGQLIRLAEDQARMLEGIRAFPVVRCAGCHVAAALVTPGRTDDGEDGFRAPPGWNMRHDRPYCATCLAKVDDS